MSIYNSIELTLRPIYEKENKREVKKARKLLKKLEKKKAAKALTNMFTPAHITRKKVIVDSQSGA